MDKKEFNKNKKILNFLVQNKQFTLIKHYINDNKKLLNDKQNFDSIKEILLKLDAKEIKSIGLDAQYLQKIKNDLILQPIIKNLKNGNFVEIEKLMTSVKDFSILTIPIPSEEMNNFSVSHFFLRIPYVCFDEIDTKDGLSLDEFKENLEAQDRIIKKMISVGIDLQDYKSSPWWMSPTDLAMMEMNYDVFLNNESLLKNYDINRKVDSGLISYYYTNVHHFKKSEVEKSYFTHKDPIAYQKEIDQYGKFAPLGFLETRSWNQDYNKKYFQYDSSIFWEELLKCYPEILNKKTKTSKEYQKYFLKKEYVLKNAHFLLNNKDIQRLVLNVLNDENGKNAVPTWTKMEPEIFNKLSYENKKLLKINTNLIAHIRNKNLSLLVEDFILNQNVKKRDKNKVKVL